MYVVETSSKKLLSFQIEMVINMYMYIYVLYVYICMQYKEDDYAVIMYK